MLKSEYENMINRCVRCSICKWIPQVQIKNQEHASICPSIDFYNFHSHSGGGRIILALALEMGRVEMNEKVRDIVFQCTACGGCSIACQYLNTLDPTEVIMDLRRKLVQEGVGPMPKHQAFMDNVIQSGNPYGEPRKARAEWLEEGIEIDDSAETLYFVGCTSSYRRKEIARATAKVLNKAGLAFKILGSDETCCGSPLFRTGEDDQFEKIVERNVAMIEKAGIETVVCSCAGCFDMFRVEYPERASFSFNVISTAELFNRLIDEGRLKTGAGKDITVTYHDPCHLGRQAEVHEHWEGDVIEVMPIMKLNIPEKPKRCGAGGVYDAPRNVLEKLNNITLVEMDRIREYSYCCGAGGGAKAAFPEFALHTGKTRISEAESTGATCVISACPFCSTNLKDSIKESESSMDFKDLGELVLESLGRDEKNFDGMKEDMEGKHDES
ncbi:hypothetical protein GF325_09510 [Candidatus Bathyarchaeota archaeon]|nr:hypothetical protein [Candidatus Bathyarchaeota archaeon]